MKSHYRLIEEEEHLIQESNESELDIDSNMQPRVQVGYSVGIHGSMFDIDRTGSKLGHEELNDSGNISKEREDLTETVVVRCFPPFLFIVVNENVTLRSQRTSFGRKKFASASSLYPWCCLRSLSKRFRFSPAFSHIFLFCI